MRGAVVSLDLASLCWSRAGSIHRQDKDLTNNQGTLEQGTRARNREFHEHLQAIHEKIAVVEHKVSLREGSIDRVMV